VRLKCVASFVSGPEAYSSNTRGQSRNICI
jgi:hypothetical protein